jgi:hypothetical protein
MLSKRTFGEIITSSRGTEEIIENFKALLKNCFPAIKKHLPYMHAEVVLGNMKEVSRKYYLEYGESVPLGPQSRTPCIWFTNSRCHYAPVQSY